MRVLGQHLSPRGRLLGVSSVESEAGSEAGWKGGLRRSIGRPSVGGGLFSGRGFARTRPLGAGRHRAGGGNLSCHNAGESWSACLPKGKWAVPWLSRERLGFQTGRNGGNPKAGPSPTRRATFRWSSPGGDFRAGGNLGEAGQPKLPLGNRMSRHGQKAEPLSGAAAPSGAPVVETGIASLPGEAKVG